MVHWAIPGNILSYDWPKMVSLIAEVSSLRAPVLPGRFLQLEASRTWISLSAMEDLQLEGKAVGRSSGGGRLNSELKVNYEDRLACLISRHGEDIAHYVYGINPVTTSMKI